MRSGNDMSGRDYGNRNSYNRDRGNYSRNDNGEYASEPHHDDYRGHHGVHGTTNYFNPRGTTSDRPSRWANLDDDKPAVHSNHTFKSRFSRVNKLGFHGNMYPSKIMENDLFYSEDHVKEGINFENVVNWCAFYL